jgi:hypothetical protein
MRDRSRTPSVPAVIGTALLVMALGACRPKSPETPPAPTPPAPETAAPAETPVTPAPPTGTQTAPSASMDTAQAAGGQAVASAPELSSMTLAATSSKLGAPVDLRYSFDGAVEAGRPVTLHLAAVPRVAGNSLSVSVKEEAGIQAATTPITAQKASAGTAYRQQLSVTRAANGPAELRVLVTMDMPIGQAHSWFSVPFNAGVAVNKRTTIEQH